jgi:chromosome segregation ATPase
LKALHENFSRTLQSQGEHLSRIDSLEQQQRQTSQALDRCTSDVEQQQAERRLVEAQLQKTKEVNAQLRKDLSFFEERNKQFEASRLELQTRLETSLAAARENEARLEQQNAERQQMRSSLESARRELQDQSHGCERLEQELQLAREALQDREARLQKQTAECQVLQSAMDSLQRSFRDGSQRDLELSKLQSALELERVERKRQETQLARTRHSAQDAAHAARTLRNSLRRQIREPVDNLVQSARSLLEQEMGDAQKNIAEAVLQDGLLVQTRLREPELVHSDSAEVPATKNKALT